ncbi:MAG: bacteriohemerythrin [Proteobacteria bacterium]|nr:bacteriohemerythrin [Pseudomonadota bacterium]MDA0993257.1 bacteriohemerythrin [Pseudomonadota bacterium]
MTLLTWEPEYSVGIEGVDFEHREMIEMLNALYEETRHRMDPDAIDQFLGEIHATISAHFALEECVMRKFDYDEYEAHKDDHEELLDQIRELMDIFARDPEGGVSLLRERLSAWFSVHFSTFDSRLHGKLDMSRH